LVNAETAETKDDEASVDGYALGHPGIEQVVLHLVGGHVESDAADQQGDQGVDRRPKQEGDKVAKVAVANACADPWAVMVMYLDAYTALAAVEGARRSQELARVAIT
jgi:hypothetical protein